MKSHRFALGRCANSAVVGCCWGVLACDLRSESRTSTLLRREDPRRELQRREDPRRELQRREDLRREDSRREDQRREDPRRELQRREDLRREETAAVSSPARAIPVLRWRLFAADWMITPQRLRKFAPAGHGGVAVREGFAWDGPLSVKEALRPGLLSFLKFATRQNWDWVSPLCLLALSTIGLFFIYSAQLATGLTQWKVQVGWMLAGGILYTAVAMLDYQIWLKFAHWVYVASMILLVAVLVPGIGSERYGAQRWIDFGPVSFQPSELAKLATLLTCASILARNKIGSVTPSFLVLGKLALAVALPMILILLQPNLGTALVIPPMVVSLLYVAQLPRRFFLAAIVLFALLGGVVTVDMMRYYNYMTENNLSFIRDRGSYEPHSWLPMLHDYQRNRILATVDPERIDPKNIGWNLRQSLISVGSGGLTGKGWTEGTQAQLGYLPPTVAHNDFIFSVLAEEKGFLGSLTVIGLFGVVLMNGVRIAGLARDRFGTYLALGVSVIVAMHVFVNIGMTIGLMPITGLPLPFLSYGGSFVLSCCLLQGLVQSVYRFRRDY